MSKVTSLSALAGISLLIPGMNDAATCATAAGGWSDIYFYSWNLSQNAAGQITGTVNVAVDACPVPIWTVQGNFLGNGGFQLQASNPTGGQDQLCAAHFSYSGQINKPGCNTGAGDWVNPFATGTWFWSKACEVPTGEFTVSLGWGTAQNLTTVHMWSQSLQPGSINFGGRTTNEGDGPGGSGDSCYFPGSVFDPFDSVTGFEPDTGQVDTQNVWGPDFVGYKTSAVFYYRAMMRAPCGTSFGQRMFIDCSTSDPVYVTNLLGAAIGTTTVSSSRAGQTQTRTFP